MPLTAAQAATIARKHGLTLMDAAGLLTLADDEDDADRIAGQFATVDPATADRKAVSALFGDKPELLDMPNAGPLEPVEPTADAAIARQIFRRTD